MYQSSEYSGGGVCNDPSLSSSNQSALALQKSQGDGKVRVRLVFHLIRCSRGIESNSTAQRPFYRMGNPFRQQQSAARGYVSIGRAFSRWACLDLDLF
jgi:hypothetical protein